MEHLLAEYEYSTSGDNSSSNNRVSRLSLLNVEMCSSEISKAIGEKYLPILIRNDSFEEYIQGVSSNDSVELLLEGTINMVNKIIEKSVCGHKVDVLFFLDKSARNGAYLLRTFWSELNSRGEIPKGVDLPEIRFLNVGGQNHTDKNKSEAALTLLGLCFQENDLKNKKVVLVDDHIVTGTSIKLGMKIMKTVFGIDNIEGWENFPDTPSWYDDFDLDFRPARGCKGVRDFEDFFLGQRSFVFRDLYRSRPEDIIKIYELALGLSKQEFRDSLVEYKDTITRLNLKMEDADHIWDFLKFVGGFLARPLSDEESKRNSRIYRGVLKEIVVKAMEYRDKNGKSL